MSRRSTKSNEIVEQIRREILVGEILPGEWLRQDKLAERLGISSTPVREALRRLESDGLVEHIPYQGVRVVAYTLDEIQSYYDLRVMLEGYSAQLVASKQNVEDLTTLERLLEDSHEALETDQMVEFTELGWAFHEQIAQLCTSRLVQDVLTMVWRNFQFDTMLIIPDKAELVQQEHQKILEAIRRHDAEGAAQAMRDHVEHAREAIISRLPRMKTKRTIQQLS